MMPPSPSARLPGLDVLRGIAALCVLALHAQFINGDDARIFSKGYLAVDLFFMLSGYVMARTYDPRLAAGLSPAGFLVARYRRLWPVMAIGSAVGLPKLWMEMPDAAAFGFTAVLNLLLLPLPAKGPGFPLNIPAWSILLELTANLAHALLLWRLGVRWLIALAAATVPLIAWVGVLYGTLDVGAHTVDFFAGLPRVILAYLIGMVLWRVWRDRPTVAMPPPLAFTAMPLLFSAAWLLGVEGWGFDLVFIIVVCPLLIAGALRLGEGTGASSTIAAALGALSFPLYAVHMPVLQGMRLLGFGTIGGALAALTAGAALTLAIETLGRRRRHTRKAMA